MSQVNLKYTQGRHLNIVALQFKAFSRSCCCCYCASAWFWVHRTRLVLGFVRNWIAQEILVAFVKFAAVVFFSRKEIVSFFLFLLASPSSSALVVMLRKSLCASKYDFIHSHEWANERMNEWMDNSWPKRYCTLQWCLLPFEISWLDEFSIVTSKSNHMQAKLFAIYCSLLKPNLYIIKSRSSNLVSLFR